MTKKFSELINHRNFSNQYVFLAFFIRVVVSTSLSVSFVFRSADFKAWMVKNESQVADT